MNIRIGICDDISSAVRELKRKVEEYLIKYNRNTEIMTFLSGKDLIAQAPIFNIVFWDIDMPAMDGIETSQ